MTLPQTYLHFYSNYSRLPLTLHLQGSNTTNIWTPILFILLSNLPTFSQTFTKGSVFLEEKSFLKPWHIGTGVLALPGLSVWVWLTYFSMLQFLHLENNRNKKAELFWELHGKHLVQYQKNSTYLCILFFFFFNFQSYWLLKNQLFIHWVIYSMLTKQYLLSL